MNSNTKECNAANWYSSVNTELKLVESVLQSSIVSEIHSVQDVADGILSAGGKRIRPTLVLLSALVCGGQGDSPEKPSGPLASAQLHTATQSGASLFYSS